MKKVLVAFALALVPLAVSPASAITREPTYHPTAAAAPDPRPTWIVIFGKVICW
jgi:hypothetical protein